MAARGTPLAGRSIAVTGAARGIGLAIARTLAREGARVALGDLAGAPEAAAQISGSWGGVLDVTDEDSFRQWLADARDEIGELGVLVNNAGVMWVGDAAEEPAAAVQRQVEVNLVGVIRGHRLALPAMLARNSGQIVTVASAASRIAAAGEATYSATKHGVLGYTTALRAELRRTKVEVGVVMPVVVDTELAAGTSHGVGPRLTPQQVADAVVSMIRKPRAQLPVPQYFSALDQTMSALPSGLREKLMHRLLPDQRESDMGSRADYQKGVGG